MLWSHVMAAIVEEYLGWQFGPLMGLGVVLVAAGAKARSSYAMCVGGVLVLLILVSYSGR
ncbi:hypothetical protein ACFWVC_27510 [Streptomyces sp. NPDC058691]|uniref:hypothetical protein n=1 Tax=Streptomyces sp. NPDC058691 TaxID=3346601 RepID=UPI0036678A6F